MIQQYYINLPRLSELTHKINLGSASQAEKDEYMMLIYQNGSITSQQYDDYLKGINQQQLIRAGLAIGAFILLGHVLDKALSKN